MTSAPTSPTSPTAPITPTAQPSVDAHHHLWDPAVRAQDWLGSAGMEPLRRRFGVDDLAAAVAATPVTRTVLVQVLADESETRDFLTTAAGTDPTVAGPEVDAGVRITGVEIAGVVGWVDLTAPDVADHLAALREGPGGDRLVGVRHLVEAEADPDWLRRPAVLRGLRAVAAAGLGYDLLVRTAALPAALDAVRAVPGGRFVLDHGAKPPVAAGWSDPEREPWVAGIRALAAESTVAVKVSGLVTEADHAAWTVADLRPWAAELLAAFGPGRAMFGSDWPVCLLAGSYDRVATAWAELVADLSPAERDEVGGGTAARWYGLDGPS